MLTDVLAIFMQRGVAAIAFLTPYALGLYGSLVTLDFVWATIQNALNDGSNMFRFFTRKIIRYGIFLWIIKNYKYLIDQVLNTFITIGLTAGGNSLSKSDATNPSYIIELGYKLMDKMYSFRDLVQQDNSTVSLIIAAAKGELTVAKLFPNFFFWLVSFLIFLAFTIIAIQIFITWVESFFVTSIAVIFIPFSICNPVAFLGEQAIRAVIGAGVKIMMLLFVVSASFPILETWTVTSNPTTYESLKLLSTAGAIAFLCWQAPAMAAGFASGSPSLSSGSMFGGVAAAAGIAGAIVSATRMGVDTIRSVTSGMKQIASTGQDISSAEHTLKAADMTGVESNFNSFSPISPTGNVNPAKAMTAESIVTGIDHSSESSSQNLQDSQSSVASQAGKIAEANNFKQPRGIDHSSPIENSAQKIKNDNTNKS